MFDNMRPGDFLARRRAGELWQLLDVREPWEIEIAGVDADHEIPMGEISTRFTELDASRPVAVLCHSGGRSARVAEFLCRQGFSSVANIDGGIDAWSQCNPSIPRY